MLPAAASVIRQAIRSPYSLRRSGVRASMSLPEQGGTIVAAVDAAGTCPACQAAANVATAGAGRREQRVDVAVVAAGELDDQLTAGEAASQPDRRHRRLRARRDQPNHLDRGARDDLLGEQHLGLGRRAERRAGTDGPAHRVDDLRMGVAEDHRPPGADQVDVLDAVHIGQVGTRCHAP